MKDNKLLFLYNWLAMIYFIAAVMHCFCQYGRDCKAFTMFTIDYNRENIEGEIFSSDDDLVKIIHISITVKVQDIYVSS